MEEKALCYFRIKTECTVELPNAALAKKKIEELVLAANYTEAEILAIELTSSLNRAQFGSVSYEIIKTKISDVFFNEVFSQEDSVKGCVCNFFKEDENSGVGLYSAKVIFPVIDEKTAKEKTTTEVYYIPALSNADASHRIEQYLKNMSDFAIRDVKFDKAEAIYWPLDVHKKKVEDFDLN